VLWLTRALGGSASETRAYVAAENRYRAVLERLHRTHDELAALYASKASDDEKRATKVRVLTAAQHELGLTRPLNNAALAGFSIYDSGAPAFARLLAACDGSWKRFVGVLAQLEPSSFAREQQEDIGPVIDAVTARGCAAP
jgi:predicted aminopeptidase